MFSRKWRHSLKLGLYSTYILAYKLEYFYFVITAFMYVFKLGSAKVKVVRGPPWFYVWSLLSCMKSTVQSISCEHFSMVKFLLHPNVWKPLFLAKGASSYFRFVIHTHKILKYINYKVTKTTKQQRYKQQNILLWSHLKSKEILTNRNDIETNRLKQQTKN